MGRRDVSYIDLPQSRPGQMESSIEKKEKEFSMHLWSVVKYFHI